MPANVDLKDILHAVHGVDFPTSRGQLMGAATDNGGNGNVILVLEHLPDRTYDSATDLTEEVQRVYAAASAGDTRPAATNGITTEPRGGDIESREPSGPISTTSDEDGKAQVATVLERNRKLMDGTVEAGPAGEAETGVGHSVKSDRSHAGGDYSSD